ncbi:FYVE and coiled-coil domain-containing protein 1-like isoform X1 [Takifugu flavidus]|uniref:FYVE and coiled-coil domain-containing protein 1-like isoform X1 n=1 Tax=Takifugu flavidus TaxID=433684 RepID=UPI0025449101|nr:FYVE and coiled-coil domain-containing protein 1-like isoform X1 [Takifugu flavidus]XP_056912449.1 FYVE and coiled-coil domain-containing protein 1-like isoform X1 [Takifugu flavidus]XP_056912450.1 FYVE and coiled-coil domain-containing protein 1-like isoform X1 [Takifugu flavidus]XP_056912451.1 FYVE and coiled-coil domain-containing protein 1-like isoform X1 [Takifugu flavidus]XP_056912452.1 FYVE and coiled-coil domain-containing protein 1-like isoform X1 [Takifugu flavidus]XP_056912453.1 
MASSSVGDNQLQRIIKDLQDAVFELSKEYQECGEPISDDSANLHKFFFKLEYLLQFDQKEKTTFLGQRKDYWDYFCDCLIKIKGANDGIRFVKSIPELKTSLGKGRAFIRYSLVHQRLADTLQQCLINQKVTSEWFYDRSPFLKSHLTADIINNLYELNQIHFDVAARGYDLDADWPKFARRTISTPSAFLWKPPSRCSSINSLVSSYSHLQPQEGFPVSDLSHSLLGELGEPSPCNIAESLRIELDQSELRQQELLEQVQKLNREASELKNVVEDLQGKLLVVQRSTPNHQTSDRESPNQLPPCKEAINAELQVRLTAAEKKNMELITKLDEALKEKGQQTASYCNSAWKIQDLLEKLKTAEEEKLDSKREAEDRARQCERLSQELRLREEELKNSEEKVADVKARANVERDDALRRLEELQSAVSRIQGALTLKEKEAGNLRAQLQDLQTSLECRERQAEELRKRLQEEREEEEQRCSTASSHNQELEVHLLDVKKTLKNREKELATSSERIKHLEEKLEKLAGLADNDDVSCSQTPNVHDYKIQYSNLMEVSGDFLQTVQKGAERVSELTESSEALLEQLAYLRASEKHLKRRIEAANMCVEDRERKLLDDNLHLEEILQKTLVEKEAFECQIKKLEHANRELVESQSSLKKLLKTTQQELDSLTAKFFLLDKNLTVSQRSQAELLEKIQEAEAKLCDQTFERGLLQARVDELERRSVDMHDEKGAGESNEKMQKPDTERGSPPMESKETPFRLVIAEAQLELNLREVQRLQEEVVELRAQLLAGNEERMKVQALQEVTESSREDLRVLTEQLKAQVEDLNRRHVDEILRSREREEALIRERDGEAQARAGLATEVTTCREDFNKLKVRYDALSLENSDSREALHRANTEMAELGVHVCMLTAENEEARLRWEGLTTRLEELKEEAARDVESQKAYIEQLRQENQQLLHEVQNKERLLEAKEELQVELNKTQREAEAVREKSQGEIQSLNVQLSNESLIHRIQLQTLKQELQEVESRLNTKQEKVVELENNLKQVEDEIQRHCQQIEEKNIQMAEFENLIQQKEEEIIHLKGNLSRSEGDLAVAQKVCQEMSDNLRRLTQDKQTIDLRTAAELDDLYRTKINLEERLVELIREKDALWQKNDALEFEQKLRDEETERDVNHCVGCHTQFSWWLRKYNCRLCGRPFCYYCCSNNVSTQPGGSRERCCVHCYNQHSAVVERHPQEEVSNSAPGTPFSRLLQAGRALTTAPGAEGVDKLDDGIFDIITEEEVSGVYDSDSLSFSTACSPGHGQQGAAQLSGHVSRSNSASTGDIASEDVEDVSAAVQDAEIYLLKSGELTLDVHFTVDDISGFEDSCRDLFIKSSCYSTISIIMKAPGPTVTWTFTSEPKSISFSVVYRESMDTPLEQAKVLIPLTRCNAHKETIQGELKVRNSGEYTLIFDNSFSRFISKKVLYHLSLDKPVVYDGTDLL